MPFQRWYSLTPLSRHGSSTSNIHSKQLHPMVIRFVTLLLSSITLIIRIEPSLAFSRNQCKSSINQLQHRGYLTHLHSSSDDNSEQERKAFTRCMQSLAIIAASIQILSAGQISALPGVEDVSAPTTTTRKITDLPNLSEKFPEVAAFLKDVDLSSRSDEFLSNLPRFPAQLPTGSKLLTTTVRPDMNDMQKQFQQFEEIKKIQWWKNTGVNFGKAFDDVQSQLKSLPDELLHMGDKIKTLSPNWQVVSGVIGVIFVADILQNSKQLSKTVEEQNTKLLNQETKLDSSNSANKETINVLKTESMKLIVEVDSLIKQLDDKASQISTLNDTLVNISMNINTTDSNSKQLLIQYSRQLESAEILIKALKTQIVEIPKKTAREVATEYKNQITIFEKKNEELKLRISRMEEEASKPNKQNTQSKTTSFTPRFPPISTSFPSSIFSPPINPLVLQNELQTVELNEIKMKVIDLELENKGEISKKIELDTQITELQSTLTAVEKELSEKKQEESVFFQELNSRLSNMEKQINGFTVENNELKEKLSIAEDKLRIFSEKEVERLVMDANRVSDATKVPTITISFLLFFFTSFISSSPFVKGLQSHQLILRFVFNIQILSAEETYESAEKSILLNQLTSENDDLKQRLLNSDERLFDLQQDNLNKLEAAKIMTKQLNARLTEIGVQQENKDGKSKTSLLYIDYRLSIPVLRL